MRKEIKKAPTIRFQGFNDDWEQRKLGDYVTIISGDAPSKFDEGNELYVKVDDLNCNSKYVIDSKNKVALHESINRAPEGSVVFPKRGAAIMTNKVRILADDCYIDTNLMALSSNKIDSEFLYNIISKEGLYKIADTSTIPQINNKHIEPYEVLLPRLDEQRTIGKFFKDVDNFITLHQRKLDQLKKLKKYFLQNMFPAKGEKVPRIRFKGFTGDWEERKLGECAPIRGGFAFESKKFVNSGVPIIRISNILGDGNVGGEFTYYDEQNNDSQYILPDKALIMAMSGATTGKVGILDNPNNLKYYQNQRVGYFLQNDEYDYKFIGTFLRSNLFQNQLKEVLVSGAQPNISGNDINKLIINIPVSLAEQKQIGRIMELFDEIIAIHHRRLDQLQTMKKYMLQNLFDGFTI